MYQEDTDMSFVVLDDGDVVPVNVFVGVDPATDVARRDSDFSVLLAVAVDCNNRIYVLDYIRNRSLPVLGIPGQDKKGIVDYIFEWNDFYHPNLFTIEETTMSPPIFQSLESEMIRRNDFGVKFCPEKPGTRMSKRDRIQEILAQRFAVGQIHIKKEQYDLHHEITTFGPRMAHDDTVDALAYACKYAYPADSYEMDKNNNYYKPRPKPKNWVVA